MENTYFLINGGWYLEVGLERYTLDDEFREYVDFFDLYHAKTLTQRLIDQPDLLSMMLNKMQLMHEHLDKDKILYVNPVGGFYLMTEDAEIEACVYAEHRPYEPNEGLTGWLDVDGTFYECLYGMHSETLDYFKLNKLHKDRSEPVYFASSEDLFGDQFDSVEISSDLTEDQFDWIRENFFALSAAQRRQIESKYEVED